MAVATVTRRQVVDMFPELLTRAGAAAVPAVDAYAATLGISRPALVTLYAGWIRRDGDAMPRARRSEATPYQVKWGANDENWRAVVAAGLADDAPDGWRIAPSGVEAVLGQQRIVRGVLRSAPVPRDAAARAAAQLAHLAFRIPADAKRAMWARRRPRPGPDEPASDTVMAMLAANDLWGFRDDCHVGAWESKGYDGPAFDVLSHVWRGPDDVSWTKLPAASSLDALAKAMEAKQDRADVERNIDALVRRGDVARSDDAVSLTEQGRRSRDAIEEETDRRYFATWDLGDAATARLGEDLRAVIDALPKP